MTPITRSSELHLEVLDQRVGEQLLAEVVELARVVGLQLDQPPDPDVVHALEAERRQRPLDRLPLRVEDALLRPNQDLGLHSLSLRAPDGFALSVGR